MVLHRVSDIDILHPPAVSLELVDDDPSEPITVAKLAVEDERPDGGKPAAALWGGQAGKRHNRSLEPS